MTSTTIVSIQPIEAAHVLHHYELGDGLEPGTFTFKLIDAMRAADCENLRRLAVAFPGYAEAVRMLQYPTTGYAQAIATLRTIARKLRAGRLDRAPHPVRQPEEMSQVRVVVSIGAEPGELFAPDAFGGNLGKSLPLHWGDIEVRATLVNALVSDEGRRASLTLTLDPPGELGLSADLESPGRDRLLHGDWTDEVCS